ncbi:hypothetical protein EYF80_026003 [Liparis tanakae]|uniref:Uncharacterized protein n=1 Tax=Liparis tanakae TaxID=230148 RepID=A0A4Z2HDW6_9TELE|nr:hypothetical protein EYF80_026003 [Liparis tanakae]
MGLEPDETAGPPDAVEGDETGGGGGGGRRGRGERARDDAVLPPMGAMSCWPIICSTVTGLMTRCEHCMTRPRSLCSRACSSRLHLLKNASRLAQWLHVTSMRSDRRLRSRAKASPHSRHRYPAAGSGSPHSGGGGADRILLNASTRLDWLREITAPVLFTMEAGLFGCRPPPPLAVLFADVRTPIPPAATENLGEEATPGVAGRAADFVMLTADTLALSDAAILFWTLVAAASITLLAASVDAGRALRALTFWEAVKLPGFVLTFPRGAAFGSDPRHGPGDPAGRRFDRFDPDLEGSGWRSRSGGRSDAGFSSIGGHRFKLSVVRLHLLLARPSGVPLVRFPVGDLLHPVAHLHLFLLLFGFPQFRGRRRSGGHRGAGAPFGRGLRFGRLRFGTLWRVSLLDDVFRVSVLRLGTLRRARLGRRGRRQRRPRGSVPGFRVGRRRRGGLRGAGVRLVAAARLSACRGVGALLDHQRTPQIRVGIIIIILIVLLIIILLLLLHLLVLKSSRATFGSSVKRLRRVQRVEGGGRRGKQRFGRGKERRGESRRRRRRRPG